MSWWARLRSPVPSPGPANRAFDLALERYFAPQVARVLREQGPAALASTRREISILFGDLVGFTRFSETASAEECVATLTHYLDELVRVAMQHDGTIDKFMGDEIMVLFSAPLPQLDHADRALTCARDMQLVIHLLNAERNRRRLPTLGLTVGVNSGECVIGHVGGEARVQYSAIGDAVNVAKRLQGLASAGDIVVGERTLELASTSPGPVEEHAVKGRAAPVRCSRLRVTLPEDPGVRGA
ncbi:MAG: adenylate/guanylate cyclase domain-containing protein [Deltaproteobacteria bacterium]|nr:adenylate/guanylate cyclase domain-containing protein [Deltaproteobacteria bacterium]